MNQDEPLETQIITQQIFGSSKKIQLIGLTKQSRHHDHQKDQMSIESLLSIHPRQSQTASRNDITIDNLLTYDMKRSRHDEDHNNNNSRKRFKKKSKLTCLYGAVAQKSYGSEKRFLCPPPLVQINSEQRQDMQLSMSILCEDNDILEQRTSLDDNQNGSFRYLHVTGTAKAKHFKLQLNLLQNDTSFATFLSKPISIISKPSKKTAKTSRNISSCILANTPVSLFNRINSQTVRTKYMTTSDHRLCAKNSTWSPFDIIVLRQPKQANEVVVTKPSKSPHTSRLHLQKTSVAHLTYGTEIILRESKTNVSSPPLILCKVDRGRIASSACGPVSQMQKIALRLASSDNLYLSAAGSDTQHDSNHSWLDYAPSKRYQDNIEHMEDHLCWTIVGIHVLEEEFEDVPSLVTTPIQPVAPPSPPSPQPSRLITPYPLITHVEYIPESYTLNVIGQHLFQAAPVPRLLEPWLGTHGPLVATVLRPPPAHAPHETYWSIQLPHPSSEFAHEELPLLLVRQDGLVYHTGKLLVCDSNGHWSCK